MEKIKYKITDITKTVNGVTVHRIQAVCDNEFYPHQIKAGDYGGWIEHEGNLSQEGNCWIFDDAVVSGFAEVKDNARVFGNAYIHNNAVVCRFAKVCDKSDICGYAKVSDYAEIKGHSMVTDNSVVEGMACVDSSTITGNAVITGKAYIYPDCCIHGNAVIAQHMHILKGMNVNKDLTLRENIQYNLIAQTGLAAIDNKVICYKRVSHGLRSYYDPSFLYKVGEYASVENANMTDEPCASGLHFGPASYWASIRHHNCVILQAEVDIDDIITIQQGKIRCKKAFIKGMARI